MADLENAEEALDQDVQEDELTDSEDGLSPEDAQALGEEVDSAVAEAAIADLDEQAFQTLIRSRSGEPLITEDEARVALEAKKEREAAQELRDFLAAEVERSRAAIAGLDPAPEAEEPAERAYGDLRGLSEAEIHAMADARLRASRPIAEQFDGVDPDSVSTLRDSEVVEPVRILDVGRFSTEEMSDAAFQAFIDQEKVERAL